MKNKIIYFCLAILIILSFAYRVYISSECSVFSGEYQGYEQIQKASWIEVIKGPSPAHPGFMYIAQKLMIKLFKIDNVKVRLQSLLYGCFAIFLFFILCLKLKIKRLFALIFSFIFLLSPFFNIHSTGSRHYAIVMAWVLVAVIYFHNIIYEKSFNKTNWIIFTTASFLAMYTHYFGILYVFIIYSVLFFYILTCKKLDSDNFKKLILYFFISVLFLQLYWFVAGEGLFNLVFNEDKTKVSTFSVSQSGAFFNYLIKIIRKFNFSYFPHKIFTISLLIYLILAISITVIAEPRSWTNALIIILVLIPIILLAILSAKHFKNPRYISPSFPFFIIIILYPFALLQKKLVIFHKTKFLKMLIYILPISILLISINNFPKGIRLNGIYANEMVKFIKKNKDNNIKILFYTKPWGKRIIEKFYRIPKNKLLLFHKDIKISNKNDYYIFERISELKLPLKKRKLKYWKNFFELIKEKFGLTQKQYNAIKFIELPKSSFQNNAILKKIPKEIKKIIN
jgi:4-amino-4-deoxy-L-arabinose transferase-like glycosyltransferase